MRTSALAAAAALAALAALAATGEVAPPAFTEVAARSGLDFRHFSGRTGKRYILEITGSGVGLFDYDGDGDLDAYFLQGARLPGSSADASPPGSRLYRNDGSGRFSDVTDEAGIGHAGYAMGVAAGDVDNDGDVDLYVTCYGPDVLYRNDGRGRFQDVTREAGLGDPRWTTSAVFFDAEGDGDLDLYVAGYLDFSPETSPPCELRGHPVHCGPDAYAGIPDRFYENDGTGRFRDASAALGLAREAGKGLGVVAGDFDADGDQDLYVANDGTPNFLFINTPNERGASFREEAVYYGAAYSQDARALNGMGTDMGDFDDDGDPDIVVTNLDSQTNTVYRNDEGRATTESSVSIGLGASTLPWVGFGVRFFDYDLDGDLDLVVANGHVMDNVAVVREGASFEQPVTLHENRAGRYLERCPGCLPKGVGRGLATGDLDNDGDLDVVISNNDGAPFLLRNELAGRPAVGLRLEGRGARSPRDAYGARVSWVAEGRKRTLEVRAGASFCSTSDPRLLLAVPGAQGPQEVSIRWPDGASETLRLAPGAYHHVVQGAGVRSSTPFRAGR